MNITYECFSNKGTRDYNEDYLLVENSGQEYGFFLADGLGGHGKGEVASELVCQVAGNIFTNTNESNQIEIMFETAQKELLARQEQEKLLDSMKTTFNILTIKNDKIHWGHIGDSRTYYLQNMKIISRTKDHSVPQMMVSLKEIKEKDIRNHPDRNRLLRVMGVPWSKQQYVIEEPIDLKKNQTFLLCTDGFWELIEERDMLKCLKKSSSVGDWLQAMIQLINLNGNGKDMDNFSAIAIWIR